MTAERRTNDTHATPEQLDYLAWYLGGESEYPCYETDMYGCVKTEGYTNETSLDAVLSDDGDIDGEIVVRGDFPSPEDALAKFFGSSHLATLSKRERQVLILTHICAMWPRQIATYLEIGVESVKEYASRARAKLDSVVCPPKSL